MDTKERIADALERIASALEKQAARRPRGPAPGIEHINAGLENVDIIEERLREKLPSISGKRLTMDELLAACGIEHATHGQRRHMSHIAAKCGFRQRRTNTARLYVAP
jgi:hypothetical protein